MYQTCPLLGSPTVYLTKSNLQSRKWNLNNHIQIVRLGIVEAIEPKICK